MNESKQTIAKLLAAFADAMDSMDDHEFELLIQGKVKLRVTQPRRSEKRIIHDPALDQIIADVARKLNDSESREAAQTVLAAINQPRRKDFLIRLASVCGVNVREKDNISMIEQKLIENVVGSKLRTRAIEKVPF
jgi:hypothetical protein